MLFSVHVPVTVLLHNVAAHNINVRTCMLLKIVAHNVSILYVKVSKRERPIMYSDMKHTASQNVKCTLRYKTFCNSIRFMTLYVIWRLRFENFMFWKSYVVCSYVLWHYVMWRLHYVALSYEATSSWHPTKNNISSSVPHPPSRRLLLVRRLLSCKGGHLKYNTENADRKKLRLI